MNRGFRACRYVLPGANLVLYAILLSLSYGKPSTASVAFDSAEPVLARIALAINAPAAVGAMVLAALLDVRDSTFVYVCTGLLAIPLWYRIGLWLDRTVARQNSAGRTEQSGGHGSLALFVVAAALLIGTAAMWLYLLVVRRDLLSVLVANHLPELAISLAAWPVLLASILLSVRPQRGRDPSLKQN